MWLLFKKMKNAFKGGAVGAAKKAFTLIETVVVIGLLVLVGGALTSMIQYFYRTNDYVLQEGTAVQSARLGLSNAMEDLREASYGDDGSYPIATAGTSTITFYADVNGDGDVEKVQYYLLNGTLYDAVTHSAGTPPSYTGQPTSTTTLATYIQNNASSPIFQYADDTGTILSSPINVSAIASVSTDLKIDVDPSRAPGTYTLLGSATLRNLEN
jgi:type II secretory pathway pseudopilin PulG